MRRDPSRHRLVDEPCRLDRRGDGVHGWILDCGFDLFPGHFGVEGMGGRDDADDDAGQGGMDAGLEHGQPDAAGQDHVHREVPHSYPLQDIGGGDHDPGEAEPSPSQSAAVEDGDDDDGPDVVDDGQGQQKDLEPAGTRSPTRAMMPRANAMSVAIGTPQPLASPPFVFNAR